MPNLGRLDGDPSLGAGEYSSEATLADLPGLIEGAHLGKVNCIIVFVSLFNSLVTDTWPRHPSGSWSQFLKASEED